METLSAFFGNLVFLVKAGHERHQFIESYDNTIEPGSSGYVAIRLEESADNLPERIKLPNGQNRHAGNNPQIGIFRS